MNYFGIYPLDYLVLAVYFGLVIYLGVVLGSRRTKTLGDFFVAGGRWGAVVSFVFVFASALAGNEAVVVSGEAYTSGLSGVWYWWSFLFATPIYYLFSTYYRRARVYNLAEFLESRFGPGVAALYAIVAGVICILFIGTFVLAVGKLLAGFTGLPAPIWIWAISLVVALYVFSGGMMSTLLTDLLQGTMCLVILGFIMLPFVWSAAGGLSALRELPIETWNLTSPGMSFWTVVALNTSAIVGGVAAPWIYNWMAVSKDERTATQCAWAHLWKRLVTLLFALYGIFFAVLAPNVEDPELAWGIVMRQVLPVGIGLVGLMLASFFAAVMSSAATYATTSSAMFIDYVFRRLVRPGLAADRYLLLARVWAAASIIFAALSTNYIETIGEYVKLSLSLLSFLGIPIYFGIVWRRANETGTWLSLIAGIVSYLVIVFAFTGDGRYFPNRHAAFVTSVFAPTSLALLGMWVGSLVGAAPNQLRLKRFYLILNTPIGEEWRLMEAGIKLPALIDAELVDPGPEKLRSEVIDELYYEDAKQKVFGSNSTIEIRRENLSWYVPGFVAIMISSILLVAMTYLLPRLIFIWMR